MDVPMSAGGDADYIDGTGDEGTSGYMDMEVNNDDDDEDGM